MNIFRAFTASILLILLWLIPAQAMELEWLSQLQEDHLDHNTLSHFYRDKPAYVWLEELQPSNQAFDAIDFISSSAKHGLDPENYHYAILKQLDPSETTLTAQQFDVLLTDGLLKLIHDLSVGRLKANEVDPDWFIPQAEFDAITFLEQALLSKHLKTELNSLSPDSNEYLKLMQALAQYKRHEARGGWQAIPFMPSLRLGESHPAIDLIQARLDFDDNYTFLVHKSHYDEEMQQAVKIFQKKHGLTADGIVGKGTRQAMNISASERVQQIKVALERRRWMPRDLGQRHIFVNLANYTLTATTPGADDLIMRIIAGKEKRQTPSFTGEMNRIVANPYWNVPRKLAVEDLLPKQQDNFNYFYLHDIRVFSRENGSRVEQDPYLIDWHALNKNNFPYVLRQDPGKHNALGRLKFLFPNKWAIYLHDTNHKSLFRKNMRSLSSGCIRVEDPIALANFSLVGHAKQKRIIDIIDSEKNTGFKLRQTLSIYAAYFTVWLDKNEVIFSPDIYKRDQRMASSL